ncbi:hypothetical protein [uncultured Kordia sp.]|uniref:hypothetical protein n=1 Tax=uncultured Kordia sp. TaxID=507699 RepID=UPI00261B94E2|nr:hypothetical protein [uncultured Kordia sp.]
MKIILLIVFNFLILVSCNSSNETKTNDPLPLPYKGLEIIKSEAVIKDRVNGKSLLKMQLFNEVVMDSIHDDSYFIHFKVLVSSEDFKNKLISKGSKLINDENQHIGFALNDIHIRAAIEDKYNNYYAGYIDGVTAINNLYTESIIENKIHTKLIGNKNSPDDFQDILKVANLNVLDSLDFIEFLELPEFTKAQNKLRKAPSWKDMKIYYDGFGLKNYRYMLMLVFEKNKLISVTSSRGMYIPKWTQANSASGSIKYYISVSPELTTKEKELKIELTKWLLEEL